VFQEVRGGERSIVQFFIGDFDLLGVDFLLLEELLLIDVVLFGR